MASDSTQSMKASSSHLMGGVEGIGGKNRDATGAGGRSGARSGTSAGLIADICNDADIILPSRLSYNSRLEFAGSGSIGQEFALEIGIGLLE